MHQRPSRYERAELLLLHSAIDLKRFPLTLRVAFALLTMPDHASLPRGTGLGLIWVRPNHFHEQDARLNANHSRWRGGWFAE